ncbi:hypothetical protein, partial [Spiroplasma endosymbiont of Lariophagus distinguendus]|uniref:hypothetical protein n=1 Tax=Spiroplasma endosymbiont of Lariophagus distinguendus TaxID=2935082 RepID=UPI00207974EE
EVIKTNVGGKTLIYRNNPVITDDNDIPNKKYVDEKIPKLTDYYNKTEIDKKLADIKIIKWKVNGNRINERKWHIVSVPLHQYIYRVFVTWQSENPLESFQQVIFFKTPRVTGSGTWRIASGKIGNDDVTLNINFDYPDWSLTLNGGNGGAIISFEVLEQSDVNVYQINSKTLN